MAITLDHELFVPDRWFAIDSENRRVPDVVVASLEAGMDLVGRGAIATIVGRLREDVVVVDVDLAGVRGDGVCEAIASWCAQEGLWHLVRPSGGAQGRGHVFVAHNGRIEALAALVERLRASYRVGRPAIDLRTAVRPLSAPHRGGAHTAPHGSLRAALEALQQLPWRAGSPTGRSSGQVARSGRPRPPEAAMTPRRRREARDLPEPWAAFLATGERPSLRDPAPGAPAHTRSTWEAICTGMMLRAGWSAEQAWTAIQAAHPAAMDHARASRARWVRWVWNRAVLDDDAFSPTPACSGPTAAAIAAADAQLEGLAWSLPPRQRPALLMVGRAVLARMQRTDATRVPVPERNLVLDTGLTDRKTIRAQLRLLDSGGVGRLHKDAFTPSTKRDSSSYEFEIPSNPAGVSQIPPPSFHTPSPPRLPLDLPRASPQLLTALLSLEEPAELEEVLQKGLLTNSPTSEPSPSQVRTGKAALAALVRAGLAWCTEGGQWVARAGSPTTTSAGEGPRRAQLEATIAAERAAYRAPRPGAWSVARAAALKAQDAKEKAWWASLDAQDRSRRRTAWQQRFAALSVAEQGAVKAQLAGRDHGRGVDLAERHDDWLDHQSMDRYLARSMERQAWFHSLAPPLQVAYATAWQQHRSAFHIPRGTPLAQSRREHADALAPAGRATRDAEFLATQLTLVPGTEETG